MLIEIVSFKKKKEPQIPTFQPSELSGNNRAASAATAVVALYKYAETIRSKSCLSLGDHGGTTSEKRNETKWQEVIMQPMSI